MNCVRLVFEYQPRFIQQLKLVPQRSKLHIQNKADYSTKPLYSKKYKVKNTSSKENVYLHKKIKIRSSRQLAIATELISDSDIDSVSFTNSQNEELQKLSERLESLENLLNQKVALDNPGISVLFEENVTEEDVNKYLSENQKIEKDSYGAVDDYVEQLDGPPSNAILNQSYTEHSTDHGLDSVYLYGSADASVPMSDTPCSGCGANLHCQEPSIPGYIPSQKFIAIPKKELRNVICQRCFILKEYDVALNVSMNPEDYLKTVGEIKSEWGLVVLVVDVTDFPNSIFKGLTNAIGKKRPLYIIGNKVDLLPKDSIGYLKRTENMIMKYMEEYGYTQDNFIQHIQLVSAKTGYGIENLVTKLMKDWHRKGHVYVVGCTNVGKSTLYNALLSSDYCKNTARDYIHRATISNWPGTTLNTLKFPIINPATWRLKLRDERLKQQLPEEMEEEKLRRSKFKEKGGIKNVTLMGRIGQTFVGKKEKTLSELEYEGYKKSMFTVDSESGEVKEVEDRELWHKKTVIKSKLNKYDDSVYDKSWWCFDTPGVINPDQIINLLTQKELSVMLTKRLIQPRSFVLKPGDTMFISGLSRVDYIEGSTAIYFTAICSMNLPIHVMKTCEADSFYESHIGTQKFKVPVGDAERLNKLPALIGKQFNITGIGWEECAADILLSSVGWLAVTAGRGMNVIVRAYIPGGYGCKLRQPALLNNVVNLRGKRKRGTKEYWVRNPKL